MRFINFMHFLGIELTPEPLGILQSYVNPQCLVQLVSASSPSHQVLGSKPSLCRISAGVRLCFGYSLPQTPLVWEPLALGLPYVNPQCAL
jgi:hypothetical protein